MPDIPKEAVQAAAEAIVARYGSPYASSHQIAEAALEAAAPLIAAQARRETAEQIAQAIEDRRCSMDNQFCGSCSCRREDADLAREIGEADA